MERIDLETRRLRARLEAPNGTAGNTGELPLISLPENHASGHILSLLGGNCFVDIPAESGTLPPGSVVEVVLWK
jgi:molybdopterin biosynthesis enzyme